MSESEGSSGESEQTGLPKLIPIEPKEVRIDIEKPQVHVHHAYRPSTEQAGLFNLTAIMYLLLWYIFSGFTLFSNKYLLQHEISDPNVIGCSQVLTTVLCGFIQLRFCFEHKGHSTVSNRKFTTSMLQLGVMRWWRFPILFYHLFRLYVEFLLRFMTVVLGLIALKNVTVSFTETVKSSAPVFTVAIAWLVIGESTSPIVIMSLVPIMVGLALTSAYDLSFNMVGFLAAISNNLTDCLQNVFSKLLISAKEFDFHPIELQFYTSLVSIFLQIPISYFLIDHDLIKQVFSPLLLCYLLMNGVVFHLQMFTAYSLMSLISPVTHSVANTVKRTLLIWLSVFIFGNQITVLSGVGMVLVTVGVLLYNQAKHTDTSSTASNSKS